MSGGSYDYAYNRVLDFVETLEICTKEREMPTHVRIARGNFGQLLYRVAEAMKAIEWVDSGDKSPGDEVDPIIAAFQLP